MTDWTSVQVPFDDGAEQREWCNENAGKEWRDYTGGTWRRFMSGKSEWVYWFADEQVALLFLLRWS